MRRIVGATLTVLAVLAGGVLPAAGASPGDTTLFGSDVRELSPGAKMRPLDPTSPRVRAIVRRIKQDRLATSAGARVPDVGEEKAWLAYDDTTGSLYLKYYTLFALGSHSEIWVANDVTTDPPKLEFPEGDCRNGERTIVTKRQAAYLADQFDNTMYPIESEAFSVPPDRDGTSSILAQILGLRKNYYAGGGDNVVVLVDNVRDDNFYDTDNQAELPYIAGFYSSTFDDLTNRLVMTIDGYDWLHRTRATPPDDPVPGDPCESAPARPFLYEGTFAHEYQHLLENYVDPDEVSWVNEGLSDHAQTITGYVNPALPVTRSGFDSHTQCFLGHLIKQTDANPNPREGGPENSLTVWGDQTDFPSEILCDYGAVYSFMEYLHGQYGDAFMRSLHLAHKNGLKGLQAVLDAFGSGATPMALLDRWATMVAVDKWLDGGATLIGGNATRFQTPTLRASINWDNDQAYSNPGAPPNGSDYVRLRDGSDAWLSVGDLTDLTFDGVTELPPRPVEWTVDPDPPGASGDDALYSGAGDNLDRAIVWSTPISLTDTSELTFDAQWDAEEGYDYAYVQVSIDGGQTYQSVACTDSVDGPLGPAFNGHQDWTGETCDLSAYAGEEALIAFRYVTDPAVTGAGFWVDDVAVDGDVISDGTTLTGWQSPTEIVPIQVEKFVVRLVAFDADGKMVHLATVPLDASFDGSLDETELSNMLGSGSLVAAVVTFHDSSETVTQQAAYTLTVNGVVQPGGPEV